MNIRIRPPGTEICSWWSSLCPSTARAGACCIIVIYIALGMRSIKYFRFCLLILGMSMCSFATSQADDKPALSLTETLAAKAAESKAKTPPERAAIMSGAIAALQKSGVGEKAPKIGETFPDASFIEPLGKPTTLYQQIGDRPAIVTFYRGGWCPYCNLQLHAYSAMNKEIEALGATLVAITPELPDQALSTQEKNELSFTVLSDKKNHFARTLNIVFHVEDDLEKVYREFGIDLEKNQGNNSWDLPLAATFVIDAKRIVRYVFLDVDYKKRAEPEILISELKKINGSN